MELQQLRYFRRPQRAPRALDHFRLAPPEIVRRGGLRSAAVPTAEGAVRAV
jgi:hypothetical protein